MSRPGHRTRKLRSGVEDPGRRMGSLSLIPLSLSAAGRGEPLLSPHAIDRQLRTSKVPASLETSGAAQQQFVRG